MVALAINSGFVTYPTSYQRVWESRDITIWRPVPPPGYVAMGCISSMTTTPPVTKAVVVVHQEAVVEALLQECMLLSPGGNWWCCQNNVGSFEVSPPDAHEPQVRQTGGHVTNRRLCMLDGCCAMVSAFCGNSHTWRVLPYDGRFDICFFVLLMPSPSGWQSQFACTMSNTSQELHLLLFRTKIPPGRTMSCCRYPCMICGHHLG